MNPAGKLLAYFYAFVLSFGCIAIPQSEGSFIHITPNGQEIPSEIVDSQSQPDHYFLSSLGLKTIAAYHPVDHLSHFTHYFYDKAFQFHYLKALFSTTLSVLEGIEIKFEFIDGIFPFHFFW